MLKLKFKKTGQETFVVNGFAATLTAFAASAIMTVPSVRLNATKPSDDGPYLSDDGPYLSDDGPYLSDDFEHDPKLPKDREIIF